MLIVANAAADDLWHINWTDPADTSGDFGRIGGMPSGFVHPNCMTWAPLRPLDRRLFISDSTGDNLWNIDPLDPDNTSGDYGEVGDYPSGIEKPRAMAWADNPGWLMVCDFDTRNLWNINWDNPGDTSGDFGNKGAMPAGLTAPDAMTWAVDRLLVGSSNGAGLWNVNWADPGDTSGDFGKIGDFPPGLTPACMAWTGTQLLIGDSTRDELWNVNWANPADTSGGYGKIGDFPAALSAARGMAWVELFQTGAYAGRRDVAVLMSFIDMPEDYAGPENFWTGTVDLDFESKTWSAGLGLVEMSAIDNDGTAGNRRATATLPLTDPQERARLMQDWGAYVIEIGWLHSTDRGSSWSRVPARFKGRLSEPVFKGGAFTVTIETLTGTVDRGRPLYWSHDAQRSRHPGDDFFEYTAELEQGKEIRWPP